MFSFSGFSVVECCRCRCLILTLFGEYDMKECFFGLLKPKVATVAVFGHLLNSYLEMFLTACRSRPEVLAPWRLVHVI